MAREFPTSDPNTASAARASCHRHQPLPMLMGMKQNKGVGGGRGLQTHQSSKLIALFLNQAPFIKESCSLAVLSPLASKYFPTLLWHALSFFSAWISCTGSCHQHQPLPNESAAFQLALGEAACRHSHIETRHGTPTKPCAAFW